MKRFERTITLPQLEIIPEKDASYRSKQLKCWFLREKEIEYSVNAVSTKPNNHEENSGQNYFLIWFGYYAMTINRKFTNVDCTAKKQMLASITSLKILIGLKLSVTELREQVLTLYPKLKVLALSRTKNVSDADDIVQDVMRKVWEDPQKIVEACDRLGTSVELYLKKAVVNRFIDLKRYGKRFADDENFAETLEEEVTSDPTRRGLLLKDLVRHLIAIGDECRQLLTDRGMGMRQADLAEARDITQSAVNKRIAHCLRKLHESSGGIFNEA